MRRKSHYSHSRNDKKAFRLQEEIDQSMPESLEFKLLLAFQEKLEIGLQKIKIWFMIGFEVTLKLGRLGSQGVVKVLV